jgi:hypothetical protein
MRRLLIVVLLLAADARAADGPDLTPLKPLPMPTPVVAAAPDFGVPISFYRPSRLDVWQNLAVDRSGYFRPRVALRPEGTFYLYNGAPFNYLPVREREVMTYLLD